MQCGRWSRGYPGSRSRRRPGSHRRTRCGDDRPGIACARAGDAARLVRKFVAAHAELTAWIKANQAEAQGTREELNARRARRCPRLVERAWKRIVLTTEPRTMGFSCFSSGGSIGRLPRDAPICRALPRRRERYAHAVRIRDRASGHDRGRGRNQMVSHAACHRTGARQPVADLGGRRVHLPRGPSGCGNRRCSTSSPA